MNQNYFNKSEDKCFELLTNFNQKTNLFNNLERQEMKSAIDVMATGKNDKECAIELKFRENYDLIFEDNKYFIQNDKGFKDANLFIENHKLCALLLDYIYLSKSPLYINFYRNGMTTIHNVAKLKQKPEITKEMNIKSKGYGKMEIAKRYLLPLSDCHIYDNNSKLVHKP